MIDSFPASLGKRFVVAKTPLFTSFIVAGTGNTRVKAGQMGRKGKYERKITTKLINHPSEFFSLTKLTSKCFLQAHEATILVVILENTVL